MPKRVTAYMNSEQHGLEAMGLQALCRQAKAWIHLCALALSSCEVPFQYSSAHCNSLHIFALKTGGCLPTTRRKLSIIEAATAAGCTVCISLFLTRHARILL